MKNTYRGLGKKVMVRFRHKAVKNGRTFPKQSWVSGFLFITDDRIMLASGADQHSILFSDLLSIDDTDVFSLPDSLKDSVTALMFGSGLDVYITLVATSPHMKREIASLVYQNLMKTIKDIDVRTDSGDFSSAEVRVDGDKLRLITDSGEVIALDRRSSQRMEIKEKEKGYLIRFVKRGVNDNTLEMRTSIHSGDWIRSFLKFSTQRGKPGIEYPYKDILEALSGETLDSNGISNRIGKLSNEISKIINEMVFLDWIRLDHASKGYTLTEKGMDILYSTAGE